MEIKEELAVSPEEFFDFLYQSIQMDIKESTGKRLNPNEIKEGMTYSKEMKTKMGQTGEAKVTLSVLDPNKKYQASFSSNQGENITTYIIEEKDEQLIELTYKEDFVGAGFLKKLNYKLMILFYNRRAKKQSIARVRQIEKYIKNQRKNEE